jgi:hypothetical protein
MFAGEIFDRTCRGPQASARRTVWLGQHQRDLVAGGKQRGQRARREFWSTGEN